MLEKQVSFNDGIAHIYTVENAALPGDKPADKLTDRRTARFSNRTVGAVRFFTAKQADTKIDRMIMIPKKIKVSPQDVVILVSEDENQYSIEQVQNKTDTRPHTKLLSLRRLESNYDFA